MKKFCLIILSAVCLFASCIKEMDDPSYVDESSSVMIPVSVISSRDSSITKSSISPEEDVILNYSIFVYQKGFLTKDIYIDGNEDTEIPMYIGQSYNIYVLANVGNVVGPEREEDIADFKYSVSSLYSLEDGLPMAQEYGSVTVSETTSFEFVVERLVAKVNFNMRDIEVSGLKVKSVQIHQTPLCVRPFAADGSKALSTEVTLGDKATAQDIEDLNDKGSVFFYMFENAQGNLMPDNSDPWKKIPENIDGHDACTYLEAVCEFDKTVSAREGTVTYRMFLGEDNVRNFDVKRNKIISVSLKATEEGLDKSSWKIVSDYVQHVTSVTLDKDNLILPLGETATLKASVLPADADDRTVIWETSDAKIVTVSNGVVTPVKTGSCKIIARSNDSADIFDECIVTVKTANLKGISIDNDNLYLLKAKTGQTASLSVVADFKDGSVQTLAPSSVKFSTSDTKIATVSSEGKVSATGPGKAVITASYTLANADGSSTNASDELEVFVSSLSLNTSSVALNVGKSASIKGVLIDYNGNPNTPTLSWSSDNSAVARVSNGTVTAVGAGTAVITGTYIGDLGIGEASVSVQVVNELYSISLSPVDITLDHDEKAMINVIGTYDDGSTVNTASSFTWKSQNPEIASVDANGIVTGINTGSTVITASKDGVTSNEIAVTVKASVVRKLTLTSDKASGKIGDVATIKATLLTTTDGVVSETDVTSLTTWSIDKPSVASVNGGVVKGLSAGEVTVVGVYEDCVGVFTYTVINMIDSIIINPLGGTYEVGKTVQMSVKGTYQDGSTTNDVSLFSWVSSNPSVASVSASGVVTMNKAGVAEIKATKDGIVSNIATFEPYVQTTKDRIVLSGASELNVGSTTSVTVSLYTDIYRNGELYTSDITPTVIPASDCSWSSLNASNASVSNGIVKGLKAGNGTIKASYNGLDGTIQILIKDVIEQKTRITLAYNKTALYVYDTATPTVKKYTDTYTNGVLTSSGMVATTVSGGYCSWSSSNSAVSVAANGIVTGAKAGTAVVTATYDGASASVSFTIEDKITYSYSLRLEGNSSVKVGATMTYHCYLKTVTYTNGAESNVSEDLISNNQCQWSSSKTSIAQVTNGIVKGVANGTVTITAKWNNNTSVSASTSLTVNSSSSGSDWEDDGDDNIEL